MKEVTNLPYRVTELDQKSNEHICLCKSVYILLYINFLCEQACHKM